MNNKGFTLLELLATIAIMGLVFGIASYSVIGIIEKSKMRTEKAFIEKLEEAIDDYISLNTNKLVTSTIVGDDFDKCVLKDEAGICVTGASKQVEVIKFNNITISNLVDNNIRYKVVIEVPNSNLLKCLVNDSIGIAYINKTFVQNEIDSGKFVLIDKFKNLPIDNICLLYNSKKIDLVTKSYIDVLKGSIDKTDS